MFRQAEENGRRGVRMEQVTEAVKAGQQKTGKIEETEETESLQSNG